MTVSNIDAFMASDDKPVLGFCIPAIGSSSAVSSCNMTTRRRKVAGFMRTVVAQNVRDLIHLHFAADENKPLRLSKEAQISLSSVQRLLAGDVGASLDTLESIANVFDISVYQLVLPNLDPHNPQVVSGASSAERSLYARFRRGRYAEEIQQDGKLKDAVR